MSYATDGKCHNAEPGTYGHECGKPATWIGTGKSGFRSGFCDSCKARGWESSGMVTWEAVLPAGGYVAECHNDSLVYPYGYGRTKEDAWADARRQIIGADRAMTRHLLQRIRCRALSVDEASALLEYLSTPWS